jgi:hypothetical protein
MVEALNRVIRVENTRRMSSIAAQFWRCVGQLLKVLLPLHKVPPPLVNNKDEGELGDSKNNNPPGNAELLINDHANGRTVLMAFFPFVEMKGDNNNNGALSTALGLLADGSDATMTSVTALDHLVDGRNAPPASTTALGLPANGSKTLEEGDTADAGSIGNEEAPVGNGTMGGSSIPPL